MIDKTVVSFRTLDNKTSGHPTEPNATGTMIKPGELVDLVEVTALNLNDWRIYNQLIGNAWDEIDQNVVHTISKRLLRGGRKDNTRIEDSLKRLMQAIAVVNVIKDGRAAVLSVQLLGANIRENKQDGKLYYTFSPEVIQIIKESTVFARLKTHIMFSFRSKYALRLYEIIQKRVNMKYKNSETFSVAQLRAMLGVPAGKLTRFSGLNDRAIQPALSEVNQLSDYHIVLTQLRDGKKVEKVQLSWYEKTGEAKIQSWRERDRHSCGRKARFEDGEDELVETVNQAEPSEADRKRLLATAEALLTVEE